MYCPHCSQYIIDIGDFDDDYTYSSGESNSWSYDEDSMYEVSDDEPMPLRSGLKRPRSELSDGNDRPIKRVCRPEDIDRSDAPSRMDVDDPMEELTQKMGSISLAGYYQSQSNY